MQSPTFKADSPEYLKNDAGRLRVSKGLYAASPVFLPSLCVFFSIDLIARMSMKYFELFLAYI